jgi:hypothetical protein
VLFYKTAIAFIEFVVLPVFAGLIVNFCILPINRRQGWRIGGIAIAAIASVFVAQLARKHLERPASCIGGENLSLNYLSTARGIRLGVSMLLLGPSDKDLILQRVTGSIEGTDPTASFRIPLSEADISCRGNGAAVSYPMVLSPATPARLDCELRSTLAIDEAASLFRSGHRIVSLTAETKDEGQLSARFCFDFTPDFLEEIRSEKVVNRRFIDVDC